MNKAVIIIISIGGRKISINQYNEIMPSILIKELELNGEWKVINKPMNFRYRDIKMPMSVAILVIKRLKDSSKQMELNFGGKDG